jgi:ABC-type lipoprotein release transport system permease subunit
MNLPMTIKYAFRSLFRHKRRAMLSVIGIGVGCGVCLFLVSFVRGEGEMMMRAAAQSGNGHLQIVPAAWPATRDIKLRLPDWHRVREIARQTDNVAIASPHARIDALLAMGTRTVGVLMTGVAPETEPQLNRLVRRIDSGEYLAAGRRGQVVIGKAAAERLDVGVDDELVMTCSGKGGEMKSALLRVCGIISTGSRELDAGFCHILLSDLETITGYEGAADISLLLHTPGRIEETRRMLDEGLPSGYLTITWKEIVPELASGVKVDETFTHIMVGVVIVVVFLGIASAQLAGALERRKEFGVMAAVGMQGNQLIGVMLAEGLFLGSMGWFAALLLGTPPVYLISVYGLDLSGMYGEAEMGISNILIDPVLYGSFDWWLLPMALGLSLGATLLSSLYPAWYARRTDPAEALRVER